VELDKAGFLRAAALASMAADAVGEAVRVPEAEGNSMAAERQDLIAGSMPRSRAASPMPKRAA
jgi:hypothetical protein